jgi:hypothetical protein
VEKIVPGLLDQAGATMTRSRIGLLGFVRSVEKICRKRAEQRAARGKQMEGGGRF